MGMGRLIARGGLGDRLARDRFGAGASGKGAPDAPRFGWMGMDAERREALWTFGRARARNPISPTLRTHEPLRLQANMQRATYHWTFRPISVLFSSNLLKGGGCPVDGDKRLLPRYVAPEIGDGDHG